MAENFGAGIIGGFVLIDPDTNQPYRANGGTSSGDVPDATTTVKGVAELATDVETVAGTDPNRVTTPYGVKAALDARVSDYATAAQGALADTATQPGDLGTAAGLNVGTTAGTVAAGDDSRLSDARVPTDASVTNIKVASGAAINADKLANGTTNVVMLATERTKLTGIAAGATANSSDATLLARANHTGTQTASTISDFAAAALTAAPAETTTTMGSLTNGSTAKTTPVDTDAIGMIDSAASNVWKKLTWANLKATLKTYFDTLYLTAGGLLAALAAQLTALASGLGGVTVMTYTVAAALGSRPSIPSNWIVIVIGGSVVSDTKPSWMAANDLWVTTTS